MKKIAIDARWMVGDYRGMGRYAHNLINPIKDLVIGLVPNGVSVEGFSGISSGNSFFPWWEQVVLPRLTDKNKFDFLVCPYNTAPIFKLDNTKLVLVVHDLIFLRSFQELPVSVSLYQTLGRLYRRWNIRHVIAKADVLITVSEFTKSEIQSKFSIDGSNIKVIPNSISNDWLNKNVLPIGQRSPYIFTVGGNAPSKNINRLIHAFAIAKKTLPENCRLKIAGINESYHDVFISYANKFGVEGHVDFIGFISDSELKTLYVNARSFIFASLFEGFGIPLIEAMASGTPIVCSDSTSLPEVVGDCALLFNPLDVQNISDSIIQIMTDDELSEKLVLGAQDRVGHFLENNVKNQYVKLWEELNVC